MVFPNSSEERRIKNPLLLLNLNSFRHAIKKISIRYSMLERYILEENKSQMGKSNLRLGL